jgi:hypothetical protein
MSVEYSLICKIYGQTWLAGGYLFPTAPFDDLLRSLYNKVWN